MKKFIQILILAASVGIMGACSLTSPYTPLVKMNTVEIDESKELAESLALEYETYADIKKGVSEEDWPFDLEETVLEDDEIIIWNIGFRKGQEVSIYEDRKGITFEELDSLLGYAIFGNPDKELEYELKRDGDIGSGLGKYDFTIKKGKNEYGGYVWTETSGADGEEEEVIIEVTLFRIQG